MNDNYIPLSGTVMRSATGSTTRATDTSDISKAAAAIRSAHPTAPEYNEEEHFIFVISDETPDDWGTVFRISGWDLSARNSGKRFVTYQHPDINDPNPDSLIGVGYEVARDGKLYSLFVPDIDPDNRIARSVVSKLRSGILTDASIWAYAEDGHPGDKANGEDPALYYFTRMTLVSYGIVMMGSNPSATLQRMTAAKERITPSPTVDIQPQRTKALSNLARLSILPTLHRVRS